jgi:hypothetical protein
MEYISVKNIFANLFRYKNKTFSSMTDIPIGGELIESKSKAAQKNKRRAANRRLRNAETDYYACIEQQICPYCRCVTATMCLCEQCAPHFIITQVWPLYGAYDVMIDPVDTWRR